MSRPALLGAQFLAFMLLWGPLSALAAGLPVGSGRTELRDSGRVMTLFTYKPATYCDGPLILVLHGYLGNAEDYRNFAIPLAERAHALVVVPLFDPKQFPEAAYHFGGVLLDGKAQPRERWTFAWIHRIVSEVRSREHRPDLPYFLVGHSAGGQFVSRLAAFEPGEARRIVAANPGGLLFPTRAAAYPLGYAGLPAELSDDAALRRYLAAPLTIYLGTADNDPNHPTLNRDPAALAQGATRLERGRHFFEAGRKLAAERGWPFHWRKVEVAGIGHDGAAMLAAGEALTALGDASGPRAGGGSKCLAPESGPASSGDAARARAVDELFAEYNHPGRPGVAVAIHEGGHEIYAAGYGTANLELENPITPQTVFMAGSVGKQFTAFCVAELAREKKIDLDADIHTYLPWVPDFGRRISVLDLLHHTSGLRDVFHLSGLGAHSLQGLVERKVMLRLIARQHALNFDPGTDYLYSNSNYILLAEIVRVTSGRTLRELSQERIFKPLQMTRTDWYDDLQEVLPGRADSYEAGPEGRWRRSLFNRDTVGATSFYTTVEDLLKWGVNFLHPAVVGDEALFRQLTTMGTLADGTPINYGLGIARGAFAGHEAWMHLGGGAAFSGVTAYFPKEDFAVAILANTPVAMSGKVEAITALYLNGRPPSLEAAAADAARPNETASQLRTVLPGHYLAPFGKLVTITAEAGELFWATADGRRRVYCGDGGHFTLDSRDGSRFSVSAASEHDIAAFTEPTEAGTQVTYRRVDVARPTAAALTELVGDYHSDELDVTYTFSVDDGRLMAGTTWLAQPKTFTASIVDRFDSRGAGLETIVFVRDRHGKVQGFRSYSDRVRHVDFEKSSAQRGEIP